MSHAVSLGHAQQATQRPVFEVVEPGLLTTVQDLGRPDVGAFGVPPAGACDTRALAAANLLVGNAVDAAALEFSLLGPTLRVIRPCLVGVTGADFEATLADTGERLPPGRSFALAAGATLRFAGSLDGARGYLAVRGGLDVPVVLGSRATMLSAGFGGFHGRLLAEGDRLGADDLRIAGHGRAAPRPWPGPGPSSGIPPESKDLVELRVVRGPHGDLLDGEAWRRFLGTVWDVDPRSDRMGVRLAQPPGSTAAPRRSRGEAHLVSLPMTWGAVELPPGGAPICLLADHPTVGGYPVVAVVASADLPTLGQLRPPHRVRFELVEVGEAQADFMRSEAAFREAADRLNGTAASTTGGTRRG